MPASRKYLARHLRSLSLQMMEDGLKLCRQLDPLLEPSWGSILSELKAKGRITVTGAAKLMGVSHVHAQKQLKAMKNAHVVFAEPDPNDGRSTFYSLTDRGRQLLPITAKLATAADKAIAEIEDQTGHSLFEALSSFQDALNSKSWSERLTENLKINEDNDA